MSCQLSAISKFYDISYVRRYFFPTSSKEGTPTGEITSQRRLTSDEVDSPSDELDNWDQDWGFDDLKNVAEQDQGLEEENAEESSSRNWLHRCLLSVSPTNDVVALAHEHKICVLTQKWDPKKKGEEIDSNLTPVWETCIGVEEKEKITAILCLPLASQKRSTQGGPDWTCIIVGFSSGYVRMYSQTGVLLLSQLLHMETVERFKCRTYAPPRFLGLAETHDEFLIMYTKAIVSIDGFSLLQSLRACCNQVARATASGTENLLQPPPLAYKKWSLAEQEKVSDYVSCGVVCPNPFDQLKAASMLGGVKATVKTSPPAMNMFMTAGSGPYVGFFYAIEGFTQPILSEVAIAMANKIKSALLSAASGWLGFGGKAKEEKEKPPKIEPATPLPLRFGLPDRRRLGEVILLSPCNNYAATTDSFGRVILVDVHRGIAVRMWKGYRDAQVGWIEVKEENAEPGKNVDHYRLAQFLVIYAPRRGILEVWLAAHGPRVAAFNVSKYCRLVCPCYGMLGLNNVTSRGIKSRTFQCALIDPCGVIKTIDIPFHLALSDKSSKRARDLHQLKKLKTVLKESTGETEGLEGTITELVLDMKIASIAHQAIERILSSKYLPVILMQNLVKACVSKLASRGEENLDLDSRMMLRFCKCQVSLLKLYSSVTSLNTPTPEAKHKGHFEILTSALRLSPVETKTVLNLLEQHDLLTSMTPEQTKQQGTKVTFQEDHEPLGATSFLHAFSYRSLLCKEDGGERVGEAARSGTSKTLSNQITVSKEASEERRLALGEFLFSSCLMGQCQTQDLMAVLQKSNLPPDQLMNLLLLHWLSTNKRTVEMVVPLCELVKAITALTDVSEVVVESNQSSAWWERVRNLCKQSENIQAAYMAVVTCKAVATAPLTHGEGMYKDPDADVLSGEEEEDEDADVGSQHLGKGKTVDDYNDDAKDLQTEVSDVEMTNPDIQDWESLTVDMELWEVLTRQLEDVMALTTLLSIPANIMSVRPKTQQPISVAVSKLLHGGKGSIPEVVARYVVQQDLDPDSLFEKIDRHQLEEEDTTSERLNENNKEEPDSDEQQARSEQYAQTSTSLAKIIQQMTQADKIKYQLKELRRRFPNTLHNDILLSNCCWEYAAAWNKDLELLQKLEFSLDFLKLVQNAMLRQGVSSLLWNIFIKKRATAAARLMEKVGKSPKDRLCRKDVGMSDTSLVTFISLCADFMEILMDANCESHEVPVYNLELAWQKVEGPTPLVELATDQKATNYGLLRVHYHLLKIMSAVLSLGMKSVKVLSLFDNKGRAALFKELHSHPLLPSQKVEPALISLRKQFLCKVISTAVATIKPQTTSSPGDSVTSFTSVMSGVSTASAQLKRQRSLYPSAFKWPQVVQMLAKDFGLDLDFFKRHHVTELYSYGHDKLAEEVMLTVNDHEEMGMQLFTVAGQRVAWEIFRRDPDKNFQHMAGMSTSLTRWLKGLSPDVLHDPDTPLSCTVLVLEHAAAKLTQTSHSHELAVELLEKTKTLAYSATS